MGNLANKFLEAVNIISDAKTKSADFDRSIQVTIKRLYQEDSTKYEVEYEGALKTATGAAGYKTNDVVWAVVPRNDLTQTLQIIGLVSSIAADKQVLRSEDDKFEKVTPNLAIFETEQDLPYKDEDEEIQFIKTIWSATGSDDDNLITLKVDKVIDAIQSSLYFEIGVIFESSINLNIDTNFGIRCYCNGVTDKPKFVLDINDIIGNPYNLIGEQQKKVFEITDKTDLTSFDKIDFFAENFGKDDKITLTSFSFYGCRDIDYMTGLAANLLVSETGTDFCELGGLSTNNYNLTTANNLILKANLRYDGILVPENELSKYTYKWYLRTLENGLPIEIAIGDNPNTRDIVETWYFNKEESDNRIIPDDWFSTIKDAPSQLKVSAAALFMPDSWIWCEVVDEKGNKVKTVEGWIDNDDKSYDLQLIAPTPKPDEETGKFSSTLAIKQIAKDENGEEIDPPPDLVYKWFKDGVEMVDEEQEDKPPIRTSSITIFAEDHEYKCEVYTTNNFLVFMETHKSVFIPDVPTMEQDSVIITGQTVYLCKANGEFIGQMSPLKAWFYKEGTLVTETDLTKYSFQWDIPDNNTMLEAATRLDQQETTLSTKRYLLNEYTNNIVSVSVLDSSKNTIASTSVEITFLKNGQPGTNGTDIICYFEKDGQSIDYYQIQIQQDSSSLIEADTLSVKVSRPSTGVNLTPTSISVIDMKNQKALDLTTDITEISGPTCLKATCILKDTAGVVISTWYAYLPIVICSSDPSSSASLKLVEPSAAPYVQFSSGGNIAEDMPKTFTYTQGINDVTAAVDSKYLNVIKKDNAYAIMLQVKENAVFKGDEILPIVTLTSDSSEETVQIPILLLTNRFEYTAINGWDGTGIKLDEENNTVLAPMAGFGKKEEDNSFTGVVLGNITSDSNEDTFQGLIGMYQSERTFSLNANDGSAWFKGHIEATSGKIGEVAIDAVMPTNTSGNYSWKFSPTDGLFMWQGSQGTDPLFSITQNGLHMEGSGTFTGTINASQGGNIGGFTITPETETTQGTLKSGDVGIGSSKGTYAFWAGNSNPENAYFSVKHSGYVTATNGLLGNWKLTQTVFETNNGDNSQYGLCLFPAFNAISNSSSYLGIALGCPWNSTYGSYSANAHSGTLRLYNDQIVLSANGTDQLFITNSPRISFGNGNVEIEKTRITIGEDGQYEDSSSLVIGQENPNDASSWGTIACRQANLESGQKLAYHLQNDGTIAAGKNFECWYDGEWKQGKSGTITAGGLTLYLAGGLVYDVKD